MKSILFLSTALTALALSLPQKPLITGPMGNSFKQLYLKTVDQIQTPEFQQELLAPVAEVPSGGKLKMIEKQEPKFWPGSKRYKIRYGPYDLPAWDQSSKLAHTDEGGVFITNVARPTMPCFDCLVTYSFFDLEDEDGKVASDTSGAWLHHAIMLSIGTQKRDLECHKPGYEIAFGGGNERATQGNYTLADGSKPPSGDYLKAGYYIAPEDRFTLALELMNIAKAPRKVYVTAVWEYLKGKPEGFKKSRALWQDLSPCSVDVGSQTPPVNEKVFTLTSPVWTSQDSGELSVVVGHLHDGGTHLELYRNDKVVCVSKAIYETSTTSSGAMAMSNDIDMGNQPKDHIGSMTMCPNVGKLSPGDTMYIKAYYDFNLHPGMETLEGKPAPVMGIAVSSLVEPL